MTKRALPEGAEVTYNYQYYEDGLDIATLQRQKVTHTTLHCMISPPQHLRTTHALITHLLTLTRSCDEQRISMYS